MVKVDEKPFRRWARLNRVFRSVAPHRIEVLPLEFHTNVAGRNRFACLRHFKSTK